MVSRTAHLPAPVLEPLRSSAATPAAVTTSFNQQLVAALESYLGQSGSGSPFNMIARSAGGQNSAAGQFLVTGTTPAATSTTTTPSTNTTTDPAPVAPSGGLDTFSPPSIQQVMQTFENTWSTLTPQQTAFQLANAAGTGGGDPAAMVPGTSIAFGDLNQAQQVAYQYALNYGTGGLSMQDFLTQNAGPAAYWNQSYNQTRQDPAILAAINPSYTVSGNAVPATIRAPQEYGTLPAASGNLDNLPNPAMIKYLPTDQQAAAEAAVAAEGTYGGNIAAAADAYALA